LEYVLDTTGNYSFKYIIMAKKPTEVVGQRLITREQQRLNKFFSGENVVATIPECRKCVKTVCDRTGKNCSIKKTEPVVIYY